MKNGKTVAIVPGSFDPITYGHMDIVKRAAEMYDTVYLAVMINSEKKYLFSIEERELIAKCALKDIQNVSVISSQGMLWQLAKQLSADAIVKGYRNQTDYEYEQKMADFNFAHNPHAKTVLLMSDDRLKELSSTVVRQRLAVGEPIDDCMPPAAVKAVKDILNKSS